MYLMFIFLNTVQIAGLIIMDKCRYKITKWNKTNRTVNVPKCKFYRHFIRKCVGEKDCEIFKKFKKK